MSILLAVDPDQLWANLLKASHGYRPEVTNMCPAKEFPVALKHFGETSTLEFSFPCLIFAMQNKNLSPQLNHTRITRESYKRTVQAVLAFLLL